MENEQVVLYGYSDSDWGGSKEDMKNTSGHCFSFGSGMITWNSKKQEVVAQSTAEVEYVAATGATDQAIWLRKMLSNLNHDQEVATTILCDNKSAIAMSQNPIFHNRTKHMKIKFYYLKEMEE
ncbi:hypothetical protein ZIOFF_052563 [Zingiber officinale]|uniref:Retrovirus-related Pol polyprotein from transposon TNT 1-94 n=1 Tax=Zingiber officinale TaxID=94328 RepID=A0A8J5FMB3_ZINOF|nr:hypothetical protein ZIOFF_052563 [Zingiber officinale]